jgi:hypothetical protein
MDNTMLTTAAQSRQFPGLPPLEPGQSGAAPEERSDGESHCPRQPKPPHGSLAGMMGGVPVAPSRT